jgi:hypothetical protein
MGEAGLTGSLGHEKGGLNCCVAEPQNTHRWIAGGGGGVATTEKKITERCY